jgi:hypothetical protein
MQELLYNNSLSVDGAKLIASGFRLTKPAPTIEVSMPSEGGGQVLVFVWRDGIFLYAIGKNLMSAGPPRGG